MIMYCARAPNYVIFRLMIDLMLSYCFVNYSTESLDLSLNELEATIPTEIGQLTRLSEYTRDCCYDLLAQSLWAPIRIYLVILMVHFNSLCSIFRSCFKLPNRNVPSEIGFLSDSLGKFIIEERNNDDAFRLVAKLCCAIPCRD